MGLEIGRRRLRRAVRAAADEGRRTPSVAIVGGGLSGLAAAIQLRRAGITDFTVLEQSDGVGGTWRDNSYPGSGCDVPSALYSLSFAPKRDWTRRYAGQAEILDYAESCVRRFRLEPHLRLRTAVTRAEFDGSDGTWLLTLDGAEGAGDELRVDAVIFACGQLNRPHIPHLEGLDTFAGDLWHSARWNHDVDLAGRRVAVVGTGASAIQFVPEVARVACSTTIFQRSPSYVTPKRDPAFGPVQSWLFRSVRPYERAYRWLTYWNLEAHWLVFRRDSWFAAQLRTMYTREVTGQVVSERLPVDAVVPDYVPGCKRILLSNNWFPTLARDDVTVVTEPIDHLVPDGVVTADGRTHPADVVVFGTGFRTTEFLGAIRVTGADGRELADVWSAGATAYLGITVPGFPNCFLLYGPNTNLGHNSILFMVEQQVNYVLQALAAVTRAGREQPGGAVVDVTREAAGRQDRRVLDLLAGTAWVGACTSWYKDAAGRVTNNWPTWTLRYWADTVVLRRGDVTVGAPAAPSPTDRADGAAAGAAVPG